MIDRRAKALVLLAGMLIVLTAVPASAKPYREVIEVDYVGFGDPLCPIDFYNPQDICIDVPIDPRARFVTVEMDDVSGSKIKGNLMQNSDRGFQGFGDFCGRSKKPEALPGGGQGTLQIFFGPGECGGGASTPAAGTITFTFTSRR